MDWLELRIDTAPAGIDPVTELLEQQGVTGVVIDDEGDFKDFLENNKKYWDYVDEALLKEKKGLCRVTFYVENTPDGMNTVAHVRMAMSQLKKAHPEYAPLTLMMENVADADWENNWKAFYKPMEIGERLLVIPEWEEATVPGRLPLRLNPGLTFGTGSHATTRLCLTALDKHIHGGEKVLDLGCGSGILSIAALRLGAGRAFACDIDEKAHIVGIASRCPGRPPMSFSDMNRIISRVAEEPYHRRNHHAMLSARFGGNPVPVPVGAGKDITFIVVDKAYCATGRVRGNIFLGRRIRSNSRMSGVHPGHQ